MFKLNNVLLYNGTALGISIAEINDYLQMGVLILSGIISIIASIKKVQNAKKK